MGDCGFIVNFTNLKSVKLLVVKYFKQNKAVTNYISSTRNLCQGIFLRIEFVNKIHLTCETDF